MKQYLKLVKNILQNGVFKDDRTGTGIISVPGDMYKCQLSVDGDVIHNFPLLTTKFVSLKSVFDELQWKLSGSTNVRDLLSKNNHIWTEWVFVKYLKETKQYDLIQKWKDTNKSHYSDQWNRLKLEFEQKILINEEFAVQYGDLGPTYGHQFRNQNGRDVLLEVISEIKTNPNSRRLIIDLWNPIETDTSLLPPCPCFYQFICYDDKISLNLYQRSCDVFLGVPYNTAQDCLFLCMVAHIVGRKPDMFTHMFGDAHIYTNHLSQCEKQLSNQPYDLPSIRFKRKVDQITDFTWSDIELIDYVHHGKISAPVSI